MTNHKKFKQESQDARRHDQQKETHPHVKVKKSDVKIEDNRDKKK